MAPREHCCSVPGSQISQPACILPWSTLGWLGPAFDLQLPVPGRSMSKLKASNDGLTVRLCSQPSPLAGSGSSNPITQGPQNKSRTHYAAFAKVMRRRPGMQEFRDSRWRRIRASSDHPCSAPEVSPCFSSREGHTTVEPSPIASGCSVAGVSPLLGSWVGGGAVSPLL